MKILLALALLSLTILFAIEHDTNNHCGNDESCRVAVEAP